MALRTVAIVGRPNVGKSTLFNRIVGQRHAIVEDRARTTRDRLYGVAEWNARRYVVIDTGGMEIDPGDAIEERVQDQARLAIEEADVIVFVVDAATGETPADQEVAETLRRAETPVIMVAARPDDRTAADALRDGLDAYLAKADPASEPAQETVPLRQGVELDLGLGQFAFLFHFGELVLDLGERQSPLLGGRQAGIDHLIGRKRPEPARGLGEQDNYYSAY